MRFYIILFSLMTFAQACIAIEPEAEKPIESKAATFRKADASPLRTTASRTGVFNGVSVNYTVEAGDTYLRDSLNNPIASIFSVSYLKSAKTAEARPVVFIFNGGPGSSSVWLHMGAFGPKRIVVPSEAGLAGSPPYPLQDNKLSILDVADMVFIDPVGTGYSHVVNDGKEEQFWGLEEDAKSVADFIRRWLTEHKRWNAPKFIAGESYGTTRAGQLVKELQGDFNTVNVNGVILISAVLDFQLSSFDRGNDLPYIGALPTYAASAYYHNKLPSKPASLPVFLDEVREFATGEYAQALSKGSDLSATEETSVISKLNYFTGLDPQYIKRSNLRIIDYRFMKELLRNEGKTIGRFDSRYTGKDYDDVGEAFENDASAYGIDGAYVAALNDYFSRDLNIKRDEPYEILSIKANEKWKWLAGGFGYPNVAPYLARGMTENPKLNLFVANGYYDLATPFFSTEYVFKHYGFDKSRIEMKYYDAGHMMYVHQPSMERFTSEVRNFIRASSR